jgi:transposase
MERQCQSFNEQYKREAVELVVPSGRSITSIGKELSLRDSVLRRWVDKVRQDPTSAAWRPTTHTTPMSAHQASEIARPRRRMNGCAWSATFKKKSIAILAENR